MGTTPRHIQILLAAGLVALLLFPLVAERFYIQLLTKVMTTAIFALSLDLLVGYTGLVSFGHAAFYGLGGYALAIAERDLGLTALWTTLPLALVVSALAGLIIGWVSIRTSGIFFIMITLAFAQMLFFFFHDSPWFQGSDGMFINIRPTVSIAGLEIVDLDRRGERYYFVLFWLVATYLFLATILKAPFGQVITGIRANETRMRALGYATDRYKLTSFVIGGMLAGLAGYLYGMQDGFIAPEAMHWRHSGTILVTVILGGMGTLTGPIIGAFVMVLLEDWLAALTDRWLLIMGIFVIAVVLLLPNGIAGGLPKLKGRARTPPPAEEAADA